MYPNERLNEIIEILEKNRYVSVEYLSRRLHISPSSIRRDLSVLEKKGLVMRSYGGAELVVSDHLNIPFSARMQANAAEKKEIAAKAAALGSDDRELLKLTLLWRLPALIKGAESFSSALRDLKFNAYYPALIYSALTGMIEENRKWQK